MGWDIFTSTIGTSAFSSIFISSATLITGLFYSFDFYLTSLIASYLDSFIANAINSSSDLPVRISVFDGS